MSSVVADLEHPQHCPWYQKDNSLTAMFHCQRGLNSQFFGQFVEFDKSKGPSY